MWENDMNKYGNVAVYFTVARLICMSFQFFLYMVNNIKSLLADMLVWGSLTLTPISYVLSNNANHKKQINKQIKTGIGIQKLPPHQGYGYYTLILVYYSFEQFSHSLPIVLKLFPLKISPYSYIYTNLLNVLLLPKTAGAIILENTSCIIRDMRNTRLWV